VDKLAPLRRLDRLQRRQPVAAVIFGVIRKSSDDNAGNFAALLAYYGFLSIFPLLLLAVSILGFIIQDNKSALQTIEASALAEIPVIGDSVATGHLRGSGLGVAVGALGALWGGLSITIVVQNAFNAISGVPYNRRPNFVKLRLRGLRLLVTVGVLEIVSTVIAGVVSGNGESLPLAVGGYVVAFAFNVALFFLAFRQLSPETMPTRALWPGIAFSAISWELLQSLGGLYVAHVLKNASATYGTFATVIGLLAWLFLGARLVIYAAELNSVLHRRYWPRSLLGPATVADDAVHRSLAEMQDRSAREEVEVSFDPPPVPH
jgi:YihY family inner membrane protein